MTKPKYCLVIPHFNHVANLEAFLPQLLSTKLPCLIVDDGSADNAKQVLRQLLADSDQCQLSEHVENQGKGAAMMTGAKFARSLGYTHILQIDADGQHDVSDIPAFIEYSKKHPNQIVSGAPVFDKTAPKARVYGRKVTTFWVALETLSLGLKDCLCGFRIYPLDQFEQVANDFSLSTRMEIDTEILVKSVWAGIKVHFIETKVIYPENSVSHFHFLQDNIRLICLHIRLMLGMIVRFPKLLIWRLTGHAASAP